MKDVKTKSKSFLPRSRPSALIIVFFIHTDISDTRLWRNEVSVRLRRGPEIGNLGTGGKLCPFETCPVVGDWSGVSDIPFSSLALVPLPPSILR